MAVVEEAAQARGEGELMARVAAVTAGGAVRLEGPGAVEAAQERRLEASYHDGVLTLSIPVAEKARARTITVTRADTPAMVEGRTIEGESSEKRAVES